MFTISRDRGLMRPGAHRLQLFLSRFLEQGVLERPAILVTGTNGKGSVSALLEAALRACGMRTGLYTSPHLVRPGERMRVDGRPLSEEALESLLSELEEERSVLLPDASGFELATAAAMLHFFRSRTDVDVIEIGLGGLLDSTNALAPMVSVLTTVGLEHTEILGPTESHIAFDKAHVSRRNRPLVTGRLSPEAKSAVGRALARTGGFEIPALEPLGRKYEAVLDAALARGSLFLTSSRDNLRVALATLDAWERESGCNLDADALLTGLLAARWPGRFDVRSHLGRTVLFDAAHNVAGVEFFLDAISRSDLCDTKFNIVYATLGDKDWRSILPRIAPLGQMLVLTQVSSERAVPASELGRFLEPSRAATVEPDLAHALDLALSGPPGPTLVVGSIALVGESMEVLGIEPFA